MNIKIVYKKLKENSINLTACAYHVTYAFQSKSTLCSCLNVKELIAWNRREIWSLSDCNKIRTHNQLVRKRTLNHLAKPVKSLSVRLRTKWLWVQISLVSLWLYNVWIFLHYICWFYAQISWQILQTCHTISKRFTKWF